MTLYEGTPAGLQIWVEFWNGTTFTWQALDGIAGAGHWTGVGNPPVVTRFSPNRQGVGLNRASTFSFTVRQKSGGAGFHDWQRVKCMDFTTSTLYFYGGYTQVQKSYREAFDEQVWDINCVSPDIVLSKGSQTITDKIHIPAGQTDTMILGGGTWVVSSWVALTVYTQADIVKPTTSPVYYYECAGTGAHPFSSNRIYKLGKGVTPTTGTPNAWYECTTASGVASAQPNWSLAPALGNTVTDAGGAVWTNRGDPAVPKSGNVEPGHSGADPWPTVVGDTIPWGNVTWRCMGTLAWAGLLPTYTPELTSLGLNTCITSSIAFDWEQMTVKEALDQLRASGSSSQYISYSVWITTTGDWAFTWFDMNDTTMAPPTTNYFTDDGADGSGNQIFYDKFERTIDGGRVCNYINVEGDPQSGSAWYIDGSLSGRSFNAADVNAGTDTINLTAHGYSNGTPIFFFLPGVDSNNNIISSATLPSPLVENAGRTPAINYYAHVVDVDHFQVSSDPSGVGSIIDLTTTGSDNNWVSTHEHFDYFANYSYRYYGRVITDKGITDTSLMTNIECRRRAKQFVRAYYKARDTIDLGEAESNIDGMGLPIPRRIGITNSLEGLSHSTHVYAIQRENISFDGTSGVARRDFVLGDAWEDNQDKGIIPGLGVGVVGDNVGPAPPTWPDEPVIENIYTDDHWVHAHVQHNPNTEGDIFAYQFRVNGGGLTDWLHTSLHPTVDLVLPPLLPAQVVTVEVRAEDVSGNYSNDVNATWPSITFTTASPVTHGLLNPSFEYLKADGTAYNWTVATVGAGTGTVDTTTAAEGQNSFHFYTSSPSDQVTLTSDMFAVRYLDGGDAGAAYYLDLKMKRGSTNVNAIDIYVDWYDQSLTLVSTETLVSGLNLLTSFSSYHYTAPWPVSTPGNVVAAKLRFHCQPMSGAYDWWIDSLQFDQQMTPQRLFGVASTVSDFGLHLPFDSGDASTALSTYSLPGVRVPMACTITGAHIYTVAGLDINATVGVWVNASQWPTAGDLVTTASISASDHHDYTGLSISVAAGSWLIANLSAYSTVSGSPASQLSLDLDLTKS